jgi:hypothetical protein
MSATDSSMRITPSDEETIKDFWSWQISIPCMPEGEHPMDDQKGDKWSNGQSMEQPVIFLSGAGGRNVQRKCTVPAGKRILIPVMTVVATEKEYPGSSVAELADIAKKDQDNVKTLSLTIDGNRYTFEDLKKFRKHTGDFQVKFPKDGIFGVAKGGSCSAVADGYYVLTEALTPGTYKIHFEGTIPSIPFGQDVDYTLTVK